MNFFVKISAVILLLFIVSKPAAAQEKVELTSPDENLTFSFNLIPSAPVYRVAYKGKTLIGDSELGFSFENSGDFKANLTMLEPRFDDVDETYQLVVGKTKKARDYHREVIIPLKNKRSNRRIHLVVRAFNDGFAFRYEFPKQELWDRYTLLNEQSTFNIAGDPIVHTLFWDHFNNSHEGFYHSLPLSKVKEDTLMDIPALFQFSQKTYMAITEASLRNYSNMYLKKSGGVLQTQLAPLPDQNQIKVKAAIPHKTPWRVMLISDRIGDLFESNIITSLNEPPQDRDWSWIKPGKTTFHWWNGDITPDTTFAPGVNFDTNKYYIDFAARHNIEYHSVIGYGGFPWYTSDSESYGVAGPHTDVTQPVASLDLQKVIDYANKKGVDIHVWVHWQAIYPGLEKAFSKFEEWGIKGMMVDFLNRDDQEMINIQEEILQTAAEHELFIQFHGSNKPTGLHRTYPNEFTREGALNYEFNKWRDTGLSPDHDVDIAFTRLLAGATDYHLGGFRAVPEKDFKTQYTRPLMTGTRGHMLAMYVVLESYLSMVADYPKAYEGEKGFQFIKQIPTSWDEIVVPNAKVGEYITIARRKGDNWYVGSLNNNTARTVNLSLDFLPEGEFTAEIYSDAPDAEEHPNRLMKETKVVTNADLITAELASGGGQVIRLVRN